MLSKEEKDINECTFKPKILKKENVKSKKEGDIFEYLYNTGLN